MFETLVNEVRFTGKHNSANEPSFLEVSLNQIRKSLYLAQNTLLIWYYLENGVASSAKKINTCYTMFHDMLQLMLHLKISKCYQNLHSTHVTPDILKKKFNVSLKL